MKKSILVYFIKYTKLKRLLIVGKIGDTQQTVINSFLRKIFRKLNSEWYSRYVSYS